MPDDNELDIDALLVDVFVEDTPERQRARQERRERENFQLSPEEVDAMLAGVRGVTDAVREREREARRNTAPQQLVGLPRPPSRGQLWISSWDQEVHVIVLQIAPGDIVVAIPVGEADSTEQHTVKPFRVPLRDFRQVFRHASEAPYADPTLEAGINLLQRFEAPPEEEPEPEPVEGPTAWERLMNEDDESF